LKTFQIKNKVFVYSVLFFLVLGGLLITIPNRSYIIIDRLSSYVLDVFGQLYLFAGLFILCFLILLALSPIGKIQLGTSKPKYSTISWIAMMYSTGMGAGIILRAVQEPVYFSQHPGVSIKGSEGTHALMMTFYHWGFTAWAFYGLFSLFIAYLLFVKNKNIQLSHLIPHIQNNKINNSIDFITVITIVFGVVSAAALGVSQIESGISYATDTVFNFSLILCVCITIFLAAIISSVRGLSKGIKNLSLINIGLTLVLMFYVFLFSDQTSIFLTMVDAIKDLVTNFFTLSLAFSPYDFSKEFLSDWTYYYWAFWLAWAPFTGIFIARISKGRSIRELITGVLLIPSLGSFIWFSVFGDSAFQLINQGAVDINAFNDVFTSIFVFLQQYPLGSVSVILALVLLVGFLITSIDSAIYVLGMFSNLKSIHPSRLHKITWGIGLFVITLGFLVLGQTGRAENTLEAVQKILVISSLFFLFLCFIFILFFMIDVINQYKNNEHKKGT
jgi:glycine betaine transporter